jgi:hypothetical protein
MKIVLRLLSILPILLGCLVLHAQGQTTPSGQSTPPTDTAPTPDLTQPSAAAMQGIDPAKAAEIRKMLELTGTVKLMNQMFDQMLDSFKLQNSAASADFWNRFQKEINTQELVDKMIPLYDKYYTLDDLKAVNAFYASPAGQRVLASTPQIMRESMQIGQEWGRSVATRLLDELKKEKSSASPSSGATPSSGN